MKNLLKKKDFAEAGALYFIATLFNKGIGFVTVPIFSRILTTSDYGTVTTFNSWVSMISVFISLALYNAVRNSFVDMDDKERPHFLSTIQKLPKKHHLNYFPSISYYFLFVHKNV